MPDIRNERTYDAAPAEVFDAHRDPARLARWWGPAGFSNTFSVFEFRPGGNWRFTMHGPDGKDYPNESVFRAIEENSLVLIEHVCEPHFVLEIRLHPHGHGTRVEWNAEFDNKAFVQSLREFLTTANEQNFDRLGQELTRTT